MKFKGLYGKGTIAGQSAVLLKPSTFMNLSGQSVTEAMNFFHIPPERTLIVFDDISLEGWDLADWVLSRFTNDEIKTLKTVSENVTDAVELLLSGAPDKAMNRYNS